VAVATGGTTKETLRAFGPDLLLDDLTEPLGALDWARGL